MKIGIVNRSLYDTLNDKTNKNRTEMILTLDIPVPKKRQKGHESYHRLCSIRRVFIKNLPPYFP